MADKPLIRPPCHRLASFFLAGGLLASTHSVFGIDPAYRKLGPVFLEPRLNAELSHEDNLFRSHRNERDSWILETNPRLRGWVEDGYSFYGGGVELMDYIFFDSEDDDITDYRAWLDMRHEFDSRHALDIDGEYFEAHERRGEGLTEGGLGQLIDKPVEYELTGLGGIYTYGNSQSDGRLELEYRVEEYEYQNFRDFTRFRDRDQDNARATFYYRVAPRTDALLEVDYLEEDYKRDTPGVPSWNSEEYAYLVGVTWAATGKTTGTAKVGGYKREFDDGSRGDGDGFRWDVEATWFPKSFYSFDLRTSQYSQETNGLGDFVETWEFELGWKHDWNGRTRSEVRGLYANDDHADIKREDDRYDLELRLTHAVDRWLDIGGGYRYEDRDSNQQRFNYDSNIFFFDISLSL